MAEQKKYRRLDEVYLNDTFAKPVPLLPRQTVLQEQPGMAEILIQKDKEEVLPFTIPNDLADKVIDIINKRSKRKDKSGKEFSPDEIILKCLQIDRWVANERDPLYETVSSIFSKVKLNYDNFANLEAIQSDQNNPLRTKLLSVPQTVLRLSDLIPSAFSELFVNASDAEKVLIALWKIIPQGHGGNVGPGEVALTLISDAVKGDVGDLEMADYGKIEVKGAGARMGGTGHAIADTIKELNEILGKRTEGATSVSSHVLNTIKQQLIDLIANKIKVLEASVKNKKIDPRRMQLLNSQLALLENIGKLIKNADNLDEIIKDIDSAHDLDMNFKGGFLVSGKGDLRVQMKRLIGKYTAVQRGEKHGARRGSKSSFTSITDFYSVPNLSVQDKVDGIVAARSYAETPDRLIRSGIATLMKEYGDKIFALGADADDEEGGAPLNWLVAALHMAEYQQNQQFNHLIMFNTVGKKEESAPDKIVYYRFDSNDLAANIVNLFNFLKLFKAKITMSVDATRKSVGVRLQ